MVKLGARHNASAASARLVERAPSRKGRSQQGVTCPRSGRLGDKGAERRPCLREEYASMECA